MTDASPASLFTPGGRLAEVLPGYEHRPQQEAMAEAVWQALGTGTNLAVEAGTGVGKSLAYLVPAAVWARETRRRVAVSTYTRLLQTQLIGQDAPLLRRVLDDCPEIGVAYGQENYLCLLRLHSRVSHGLFDTREQARQADNLLGWADVTSDGVLLNYPFPLPQQLWHRVSRDPAACRRNRCPYFGNCFYYANRRRWEQCRILVVNHALFFAGMASEAGLLPKADAVIFDEAHRLEEAAVRHFGCQVSQRYLAQVLDSVYPVRGRGLVHLLGQREETQQGIGAEVSGCRSELARFFADVSARVSPEAGRLRLDGPLASVPSPALERLARALDELTEDADEEDVAAELKAASIRLADAGSALLRFTRPDPANEVRWAESSGPDQAGLCAAPLAVAPALSEHVYPNFSGIVMTSATMTVAQDFGFLSGRLGLAGFRTLLLDSPFDYKRCGLLFVAPKLPEPGNASFTGEAAKLLHGILSASRGRALVLFTSYETMNRVADLVPEQGFAHLRQGELPVGQLLERFRTDTHSVLFATQSFWQGIDVPGESLSCLVICRLPFEVPDEPRLAAVCERMRQEGTEPFTAYQVPGAALRFRQGFGRLIRTKQDRGVVCVLDRRILSRGYGKLFIASLPGDLPMTTSLDKVATFLSGTAP